ncbi:hypothetical protein WJX73_004879 [Symbiochloris irregularis]|uniref:phosphoribosylamine--glycine ligase n=1 Tax=Symbiochloris irregularis TaxID=706552 RepID=A0AAW1PE73_9CHLO
MLICHICSPLSLSPVCSRIGGNRQQRLAASRLRVRAARDQQNVLLLGSGAREHALSWKLAQSPLCASLHVAPGNTGISQEAGVSLATLPISSAEEVAQYCKQQSIGLVVVGPEAPLVSGIVDSLQAEGIRVFGPSAAAARLEGSKTFLKDLCRKYGIPTAGYRTFTDADAAKAYLQQQSMPIVVKADGLAAGKGVYVAASLPAALEAVDDLLLHNKFGAAGHEIVIEEYLDGEEVSFFALVDGSTCIPLASAQDHKAVGEGDTGPNTGGMGAYSPAPVLTPELQEQVMREIVQRTADAMVDLGTPFTGIIFAGLMIKNGQAKLLEHNVRFGDPECQCLMVRLQSDLLGALLLATSQRLDQVSLQWSSQAALTVVLAAKGYPGDYAKGSVIEGVDEVTDAKVFHAGTKRSGDGQLVADGGRVLSVTALGTTIRDAQQAAYKAVDQIEWANGFCRRDIGWRALS